VPYWLLKSEPQAYSIGDLQQDRRAIWDGVRNYQARNYLRQMQPGDWGFFYHSNTKPPGIAGLMRVTAGNVTDPTQFDPQDPHYDPKSRPEAPRWQTVEVEYWETFTCYLSIATLKATFGPEELLAVKRGNRLSVMPVGDSVAERILQMAREADS